LTVSEDQSSLRAYSYSVDFIHASARVEFDAEPVIEPMGKIRSRYLKRLQGFPGSLFPFTFVPSRSFFTAQAPLPE